MKEQIRRQLEVISRKYEQLSLTELLSYKDIQEILNKDEELAKIATVLEKVKNGEKIFNVSSQINHSRGDQRLSEAFAEYDTIRDLVSTKFYGSFTNFTYLPPERYKRWPDFLVDGIPVEVKMLSPQDMVAGKFFQKLIDKVNKDALPQLASFYNDHPFTNSMIFIRTHRPVPLADIDYYDLREWFSKKVESQPFNVTIICLLYNRGMWDFYINATN
jgi:hypothetical protein